MHSLFMRSLIMQTNVHVVTALVVASSMALFPNVWMLDFVVLMLILRPLELATASIADDILQRDVDLDVGGHVSTGFGHCSAVAPVAGELHGLAVFLPTDVVIAYMVLY
jgi:hypothetical protein